MSEEREHNHLHFGGFVEKIQGAKEEHNHELIDPLREKQGCGEKCPNCSCSERIKRERALSEKWWIDKWYGDGK